MTLTPLNLDEVKDKQRLYKRIYQKTSVKKVFYHFLALFSALTFIVSTFGVVLTHNPTILSISMGIFLSSFVISIMTFSFYFSYSVKEDYYNFSQYQYLSQEHHQEMLNLLKSLPDTGEYFHNTVLAQDRKFILKELEMLRHWKNTHKSS